MTVGSASLKAAANTWTDNDHRFTAEKVALRVEAVHRLGEPRPVVVLDAFHGHGKLWHDVEAGLEERWRGLVSLYRVDKEARRAGTLKVANERLLASMNLARFDLIDLDAYGWPVDQLATVAVKAPGTMVVVTRISMARGMMTLPKRILTDLDVEIPKGTPKTLQQAMSADLWDAWLHHLGYRWSRRHRHIVGAAEKLYELLLPRGIEP